MIYSSEKTCPRTPIPIQRRALLTMPEKALCIICASKLWHAKITASCGSFQICCFKYPQRKKSKIAKSGDRGGQGQSPHKIIQD